MLNAKEGNKVQKPQLIVWLPQWDKRALLSMTAWQTVWQEDITE